MVAITVHLDGAAASGQLHAIQMTITPRTHVLRDHQALVAPEHDEVRIHVRLVHPRLLGAVVRQPEARHGVDDGPQATAVTAATAGAGAEVALGADHLAGPGTAAGDEVRSGSSSVFLETDRTCESAAVPASDLGAQQ